ncbi:MAG: hypothetical protein ACD_75C01137G0001, partial [uncultured bacterium]
LDKSSVMHAFGKKIMEGGKAFGAQRNFCGRIIQAGLVVFFVEIKAIREPV